MTPSFTAPAPNHDEYLGAAVAWIRLLLANATSAMGEVEIQSPAAPVEGAAPPQQPVNRPAALDVRVAEITAAAECMRELERVDPSPHFVRLADRFDLSAFERRVLLLCLAMELDTRIAGLCARAQDDPSRPYPTFALAFSLFEDAAWEALSPERPLRYWRLIEIAHATQPLTMSALRADERIVNEVKGLKHLDDRLLSFVFPLNLPHNHVTLPPSHQATVNAIASTIHGHAAMELPAIYLAGNDRETKQLLAGKTAESLRLHLVRLSGEVLPVNAAEIEQFARLWNRETILLPVALYLDGTDSNAQVVKRLLMRLTGVVFVDVHESSPDAPGSAVTFEANKPTPLEQRDAWTSILGDVDEAARVAGQFHLSFTALQRIEDDVRLGEDTQPARRVARAWSVAEAQSRPRLEGLAERLECKAEWKDIVLPDSDLRLLKRIAAQVGQRSRVYDDWGFRDTVSRGLGISALFAGESGTGKTMAAEILAKELRLSLYRIDLSNVFNKYVGETAKNVKRIFDEAENGGIILFFDEAEALFGKRVESRDSHDRYSNVEIAYLLQRMESYGGLAILATNKRKEMDTAFLRRLRFIVSFPFPGPKERRELWRRAFPRATPVANLDYDRLARLNIAGGSVRTIALNAAFMAADLRTDVTMPLLLDAARDEMHKLEKPVSEADLKWTEALPS